MTSTTRRSLLFFFLGVAVGIAISVLVVVLYGFWAFVTFEDVQYGDGVTSSAPVMFLTARD